MSTKLALPVPSTVRKLKELRSEMLENENAAMERLRGLDADRIESAKNLLHYMVLRRHDIRQLQEALASLGVSSLGRCESHVMSSVDSILKLFTHLETGVIAKEGLPSRSEVTDAAMGVRAECVMLNKGDYIVEAVQCLDNILQRMQYHHSKKKSMLRHLKLADRELASRAVR